MLNIIVLLVNFLISILLVDNSKYVLVSGTLRTDPIVDISYVSIVLLLLLLSNTLLHTIKTYSIEIYNNNNIYFLAIQWVLIVLNVIYCIGLGSLAIKLLIIENSNSLIVKDHISFGLYQKYTIFRIHSAEEKTLFISDVLCNLNRNAYLLHKEFFVDVTLNVTQMDILLKLELKDIKDFIEIFFKTELERMQDIYLSNLYYEARKEQLLWLFTNNLAITIYCVIGISIGASILSNQLGFTGFFGFFGGEKLNPAKVECLTTNVKDLGNNVKDLNTNVKALQKTSDSVVNKVNSLTNKDIKTINTDVSHNTNAIKTILNKVDEVSFTNKSIITMNKKLVSDRSLLDIDTDKLKILTKFLSLDDSSLVELAEMSVLKKELGLGPKDSLIRGIWNLCQNSIKSAKKFPGLGNKTE